MRTLLARTLLAATLVAAATALPATATPEPLPLPTGCYADGQWVGGTWQGVIGSEPVAAAEVDPAHALENPVSITVLCNAVVLHEDTWSYDQQYTTPPASGTAVAAVPPAPTTFTGNDAAFVIVCTEARVTGADGVTRRYEKSEDNGMWYPYTGRCSGFKCLALGANCDYTLALVAWLLDHSPYFPTGYELDPTLCPQLAARAPGVPGVADIDSTGDTYVDGELVWDCPPYAGQG